MSDLTPNIINVLINRSKPGKKSKGKILGASPFLGTDVVSRYCSENQEYLSLEVVPGNDAIVLRIVEAEAVT